MSDMDTSTIADSSITVPQDGTGTLVQHHFSDMWAVIYGLKSKPI